MQTMTLAALKALPKSRAHRVIPKPLDGEPVEFGALFLPFTPPSLNNLFGNGKKGRYKTAEYKAWQVRAVLHLRKRGGWHVPGRIRVRMTFDRSDTRADLDNLQKPILDALMAAGRISDDRNVLEIHSSFGAVKGTLIEIWGGGRAITAHPATALRRAEAR